MAHRIPNTYHFAFGFASDFGRKPFSLVHYLALASCAAVNQPDAINLYYKHEPTGHWWERAKPLVNLVPVEPPREVFGNTLCHHAHIADVFRLELLREVGGIYLDMDVICLRPFEPLRVHAVVMGQELGVGLCNAVILATPGAQFLDHWWASYRSFQSRQWNVHSVRIPYELAVQSCGPIHVLDHQAFFWPYWQADLRTFFCGTGSDYCRTSYCVHLWEQVTWQQYLKHLTIAHLRGSESEFCQLIRRVVDPGALG